MLGFVQAGGTSSRFGSDKALAVLEGKSLLARTAELVAGVCSNVRIVSSSEAHALPGIAVLRDGWPGEGPLGGILTAIREAQRISLEPSWSLIVSCDMPFLTGEWLEFLCECASKSTAQVVVPESANGLEPLCACWRSDALDLLEKAFGEGVRKVTQAMKRLPMEVLDEEAWKRFDNFDPRGRGGRLFWNMNTPEDYAEAKRILEAGE